MLNNVGKLPFGLCLMSGLQQLFVNNGGNSGITCAPMCLSSVPSYSTNVFVPSTLCVYPQDIGLCGLIAATNIAACTGWQMWQCTTTGISISNPCSWNGLICNAGSVVYLSIGSAGAVGTN